MEEIDFTKDTPEFWNRYRKMIDVHIEYVTGVRTDRPSYWTKELFADPDSDSPKLKEYHQKLWSKKLPNGKWMDLIEDKDSNGYLKCDVILRGEEKHFRFGSDIIVTSFIGRDRQCKGMFMQVIADFKGEHNYRAYIEGYSRIFYRNIGSFIIFPKTGDKDKHTINQVRGGSPIFDRFDLTLDCIRIYYKCQENPSYQKELFKNETLHSLYNQLFEVEDVQNRKVNQDFFNLFGDFKGYVDYFHLKDLVSDDYRYVRDLVNDGYSSERCWVSDETFKEPLPKTVQEYNQWMNNQLDFVEKRTEQIKELLKGEKILK